MLALDAVDGSSTSIAMSQIAPSVQKPQMSEFDTLQLYGAVANDAAALHTQVILATAR